MIAHRFILEPYKGKSTRYTCPACQKQRTFVRYLDIEAGQHLSSDVGRCNREDNCGYHYTPKRYFEDNPDVSERTTAPRQYRQHRVPAPPKPASLVPSGVFKGSLQAYDQNHFVTYLQLLFGPEKAGQLVARYYIGTSQHWQGATVFYQIDSTGKVRAGKIILYSPATGKRIKEPYDCFTWVHSALKLPEYTLKQCLFGEHLLRTEPNKPVAIVESEKTAVIASMYLPQFVWLATGGKGGLSLEKCRVLQGRKIILYPDLGCFQEWSTKAKELANITPFTVSDLLERNATEAEKALGLDLADYLIRLNQKGVKPATPIPEPKPLPAKEYYKYTFDELTAALGEAQATAKLNHYKQLSEQYAACKTFVLHDCSLLQSTKL